MISTTCQIDETDGLNNQMWQFATFYANSFPIYLQIWIRTEKLSNRNNLIVDKLSSPIPQMMDTERVQRVWH